MDGISLLLLLDLVVFGLLLPSLLIRTVLARRHPEVVFCGAADRRRLALTIERAALPERLTWRWCRPGQGWFHRPMVEWLRGHRWVSCAGSCGSMPIPAESWCCTTRRP
ncbi:hypothetical protein [Synechococcus sp. CBW1006]|uniref:hypothetical protein n=1 Tax=Synechococcus sp. CBW1006 TaxID=1353138 RepID=UPI001E35D8D1|nr:hypothetical protein [Synechococcus sp. CBW1006]